MSTGEIVTAILSSGALLTAIFTFIQWLFKRHDEKTEKNKDMKEGLKCLLRRSLVIDTEKAIDKDEISNRELEMMLETHESYKALKGNGYVDDNVERCKKLKRV